MNMIVQCMKCGWLQYVTSDYAAEWMAESHSKIDGCEGRVARSEGMGRK